MTPELTGSLTRQAAVTQAAASLWQAAAERTPCPPVRNILGTDADVALAYEVQEINTNRRRATGGRAGGRKIGLTSLAVQAQLGVDQPDYGTLFVEMEHGDGEEIDATGLLQPKAEVEVALVLEHDLDHAPHGFAEVVRATAFALPAVEIVDSRVAGWDITIVDTIADNASSGKYVLGSRPTPLSAIEDLREVTMTLRRADVDATSGQALSSGAGAACMGNPLLAARWLADVLCERGIPLRAGDVVMTGALGPMVEVARGDALVAAISGLGSVRLALV